MMKDDEQIIINRVKKPIWEQISLAESLDEELIPTMNSKSKRENELKQLGIFPLAHLPEEG